MSCLQYDLVVSARNVLCLGPWEYIQVVKPIVRFGNFLSIHKCRGLNRSVVC